MTWVFPSILALVRDRHARPTDLRVYVVCTEFLDFVEFRPLKLELVARDLHVSRSNVSESLGRLVRASYLARGERLEVTGPYTFRLVWSPRVQKLRTPHPTTGLETH